jgi:hypothetical protein
MGLVNCVATAEGVVASSPNAVYHELPGGSAACRRMTRASRRFARLLAVSIMFASVLVIAPGCTPKAEAAQPVRWLHESDRVLEDATRHYGQPYNNHVGHYGGWAVKGGNWVLGGTQNLGEGMDCKDFVSVVMIETGHMDLVGQEHHGTVLSLATHLKGTPSAPSDWHFDDSGFLQKDLLDNLQPGDIVIYGDPYGSAAKRIYAHAAIYMGPTFVIPGNNSGLPSIINEIPGYGVTYLKLQGVLSKANPAGHDIVTAFYNTHLSEAPASTDDIPMPAPPANRLSPYPEMTYYPLTGQNGTPGPQRVLDTRKNIGHAGKLNANVPVTFKIAGQYGIPASATAVTGNLTVVNATSGYSIYLAADVNPAGVKPPTSALNFNKGDVKGNNVTVGLRSDGFLSATFYAPATGNDTTNLIFDVTGYFTRDMDGSTYHPTAATTLATSRLSAGKSVSFNVTGAVVPLHATAVTAEITVMNDPVEGALYVGPVASSSPPTSSLNFKANATATNSLTVGLGAGHLLWATYIGTGTNTVDLVFTVTGYFTRDMTGDKYVPLTPLRVVDTRTNSGVSASGLTNSLLANQPYPFQPTTLGEVVPSSATAVTGNFTVVAPTSAGSVVIGPDPTADLQPLTAYVSAGEVKDNGATLGLDPSPDSLTAKYIAASGKADLILDVTGYFTPPYAETTYHAFTDTEPTPVPQRVFDTRRGTTGKLVAMTPRTFQVRGLYGIAQSAIAVTGNVTVLNATSGYAVYLGPVPATMPPTSTLNFTKGDARSNAVTIALSADGKLSATYLASGTNTTDLIFDVTGYFTANKSGATYHAVAPSTLVDTSKTVGLTSRLKPGESNPFKVTGDLIPSSATAVTGEITAKNNSTSLGALYVGPVATGATSPSTTTIALNPSGTASNGLTVGLQSDGYLSATYSGSGTADMIFTVTGYFTADRDDLGDTYVPLTPSRLVDTRYATGVPTSLAASAPSVFQVGGHGGMLAQATAVTGNVTAVNPTGPGSLLVGPWPTPLSALHPMTVSLAVGDIKGCGLTVELADDGTLSAAFASSGYKTDFIFDVTGYFITPGTLNPGASPQNPGAGWPLEGEYEDLEGVGVADDV